MPSIEPTTFAALYREWSSAIGREPDGIAVYERLQATRASLTLLLCAGAASVVIRVRPTAESLLLDRQISQAATTAPPTLFRVPRLVGSGELDGWSWVAYEVMSRRPHRPVWRSSPMLTQEINRLVESVLPRTQDTPRHWRGAHGDLTPWNLRRSETGTWLIDWEDACWAPPGADEVYFRAIVTALRRGSVSPLVVKPEHREAAQHWADIVRRRPIAPVEHRLKTRLQTLLNVGE